MEKNRVTGSTLWRRKYGKGEIQRRFQKAI